MTQISTRLLVGTLATIVGAIAGVAAFLDDRAAAFVGAGAAVASVVIALGMIPRRGAPR